jgi:rubrerythrin
MGLERVLWCPPTDPVRAGVSDFTANDILEFAVAIERNGERFYRLAQDKVTDPEVSRLFRRLASEEVAHERTFQKILEGIEPFDPGDDGFPEDYRAYLRAFVDQVVFSDDKLDEVVNGLSDAVAAVRFAKQREQDAILFYMEMRAMVPERDRPVVDELIAEERRHYTMLAELEKKVAEGA